MAKKKPTKKKEKKRKLKLMISSTVYGAEGELEAIYGILSGFGYEVIMSKEGTLYLPALVSNEAACLKAVEDCDLFLGIIYPRYGSGITHKELKKAVELNKPRWFVAHHYVTFAREILKQYMYRGSRKNRQFTFNKTSVMDSHKVIEMYNDAIQNELPIGERRANWAQAFFKTADLQPFLETQFKDIKKRKAEIALLSNNAGQ
jgi:hypothetical protein